MSVCVCSCDHGAKYSKDWHHAHFSDRSGKTQLSWLQNSCLMFIDLWLLSTKSVSAVSKMRQEIVKYIVEISDIKIWQIVRFWDKKDLLRKCLGWRIEEWSSRSCRASSSDFRQQFLQKANDIIRCKARLVKT